MSPFDLRYTPAVPSTQRHQLHWTLGDGTVAPDFTCLHGDLPPHHRCDAETFREEPETLALGVIPAMPIRDGIILTHWEGGGSSSYLADDDGAELIWSYEDSPQTVDTQRHLVHFTLDEGARCGLASPNFVCLHEPMKHCHSADWAEDADLFPEWYSGPAGVPARAGAIVSWWPDGPNLTSLPSWAYEEHASTSIPASLAGTAA